MEKQMTCDFLWFFFVKFPFSLLMWSINIQPGTHQCHATGFRAAARDHTAPYTVHKHIMWSMKALHFLFASSSSLLDLFCRPLIIWRRTMQSLFCHQKKKQKHRQTARWENALGAWRNVNLDLLSVAPTQPCAVWVARGQPSEQCRPCLALCVLSGQTGRDKAHLLLSEVLPGSHTLHTPESPVCPLILASHSCHFSHPGDEWWPKWKRRASQ